MHTSYPIACCTTSYPIACCTTSYPIAGARSAEIIRNDVREWPIQLQESTRAKLGVLVFLGMCGVGIIIFFGYGTNAQQALAIKSVQNSVSGVTTWADEATDLIKSVLEQPKLVEEKILFIDASIDTLINTVGIQEIADQGEALKQMLADVQLQYAELSSEFDAVNETVGGLSTMVSGGGNQAIEFLTKYEDMRSFAIKVTFSGLLGLIMLQGVIALSDVYCREGRRPNQFGCFGKCAAPVFSGIFLFVMFVLFLLGFAFYLLTAVTSDICVQPNAILDELLSGMDTSSPMTSSVGSGGASSDSGSGGASSDIAAELARSGSSSLDGSSGLENSVAGDPMEFFFRCNTYTAEDQVALNPLMPIFDEIDAGLVMIADETRLIEDAIVLVEAFASVPLIPAASIEAIDTFATDVKGYVVVRDAHRFETRGHCCPLYGCLLEVATLLAYPNVL